MQHKIILLKQANPTILYKKKKTQQNAFKNPTNSKIVMYKVIALGETEELEEPQAHERQYETWKNICIGINLDEASVPGWKLP